MGLDGILLLDKSVGMTSFEAVRKVKRLLGATKAGHTGTLDKAASGLLIICLDRATLIQNLLMDSFKKYRATLLLGQETDTLDRYGKIIKTEEVPALTEKVVLRVLKKFKGEILQIPPIFSAIHQNGKRLYQRALDGEAISPNPREIEIRELSLLNLDKERLTFQVLASKGTYIRSLGRDIARSLGSCGYLTELRRLAIGRFTVEKSVRVDEIHTPAQVIPIEEVLSDLPKLAINPEKIVDIYSRVSPLKLIPDLDLDTLAPGYYRGICGGRLVAIFMKNDTLRYFRVFRDVNK
jgi:tRNA pseudouridine55 synthase